jgi:alpha-beta hydrolase superfamily lysophospholipase
MFGYCYTRFDRSTKLELERRRKAQQVQPRTRFDRSVGQTVAMTFTTSTLSSPTDNLTLTTYAWEEVREPKAVVQVSHGLAEHAARYDRLATALNDAGYLVYAHDHRGHGLTAGEQVPLGSFGTAGWDGLVADLASVGRSLTATHADLPLFLIGHSMGSFALQQAIVDHSEIWAGVVLSGSTAVDLLAAAMAANAPVDGAGNAAGGSDLSAFNVGFENRTGYEWLSRDEAEVDRYVADPLCGYEVAPETIPQMFGAGARLADPTVLEGIRKDLPILVVSGDADPLAGGGGLTETLGQRYADAGITDVTVRLFPQARHEIFNETNRDEVTAVVIDWLDAHTA